jgi:DNA-binding NarL/FixJ family response regulator
VVPPDEPLTASVFRGTRAVTAVSQGEQALCDDTRQAIATQRLADPIALLDDLGSREVEILRLVASGHTSDAIADALNLSEKTVRNYHYTIKSKIGVRTDAQLVWFALSVGLVRLDDGPALPFPDTTEKLTPPAAR